MRLVTIDGDDKGAREAMLVDLVAALVRRGLTVSAVHHGAAVDRPGKDSFRHREAGAREVMVTSTHRWALIGASSPAGLAAADLARRMTPADVVVADGPVAGAAPLAVVTVGSPPDTAAAPVIAGGAPEAVAEAVLARLGSVGR